MPNLQQPSDQDEELQKLADLSSGASDSAQAVPDPAGVGGITPQSNAVTGNTTAGLDPKAYIMQKYGLSAPSASVSALDAAGDDSKVQAARKEADDNKDRASGMQSFFGLFAGNRDKQSPAWYKQYGEQQDAKVGQAQHDQQAAIKNYLTGRGLVKEDAASEQLAKDNTFKNTENQRTDDKQKAELDPNDRSAALLRNQVERLVPGIRQQLTDADGNDNFDSLTVADMTTNGVLDTTKLMASLKEKQLEAGMRSQDNANKLEVARINAGKKTDATQDKQNNDFAKDYAKSYAKHNEAVAKTDQALDAVAQAVKAGGGLAGKALPLQVARGLVSRVNQQELTALSGDPSWAAQVKQFFQRADDGTLTAENAAEFKNLLTAQKANSEKQWARDSNQMIGGHAHATHQDPDDIAKLVQPYNGPQGAAQPAQTAQSTPAPATTAPAPATAAQDPQIAKYAQDHKLDYGTADAIIQKRKAAAGGK